jgi:hypothetical protein
LFFSGAATALAACGGVASLAFFVWAGPRYFRSFATDVLPYVVVGAAATLSRKTVPAALCLAASFPVVASGIYKYCEVLHTWHGRMRGVCLVDDTELFTNALKWDFAFLAFVVVVLGRLVERIGVRVLGAREPVRRIIFGVLVR